VAQLAKRFSDDRHLTKDKEISGLPEFNNSGFVGLVMVVLKQGPNVFIWEPSNQTKIG